MAKKKLPKVLALLDEDMCTGCEACMTVCPVDCIHLIPGPRHEQSFQVCTIDLPRCIGCTLCHQVCPWDCITMIPTDQFIQNENTKPQLEWVLPSFVTRRAQVGRLWTLTSSARA